MNSPSTSTLAGAAPVCIQIWTFQADPSRFEASSAPLVTVFQIALASGAFLGGLAVDAIGLRSAFALGGSLAASCALLLAVSERPQARRAADRLAISFVGSNRPHEKCASNAASTLLRASSTASGPKLVPWTEKKVRSCNPTMPKTARR
jgi:MFS family permease